MEHKADYRKERDFHEFGVFDIMVIQTDEPCVVCSETNGKWDSYVLCCNHKAHTRCYRRYLFDEGSLKCPKCGDLEWDDDEYAIKIKKKGKYKENNQIEHDFTDAQKTFWMWFFGKLGWKWNYSNNSQCDLILNFDEIDIPVIIVDTVEYQDLVDIAGVVRHNKQSPALLVGKMLFNCSDVDKAQQSSIESFCYSTSDDVRIIGLIVNDVDGFDTYNSAAIIVKMDNGTYSLAWICDDNSWVIGIDSVNDESNGFELEFKTDSYCALGNDNRVIECAEEVDNKWDQCCHVIKHIF